MYLSSTHPPIPSHPRILSRSQQVDGAFCAPQRDLLEYFIQKDFGWWGPAWRHGWELMPRFGGGDAFTLRQKRFVYEVITK